MTNPRARELRALQAQIRRYLIRDLVVPSREPTRRRARPPTGRVRGTWLGKEWRSTMSNHRDAGAEGRGGSSSARLGSNDGLFELFFGVRRSHGETFLSVDIYRKSLWAEGVCWSIRLGPSRIATDALHELMRATESIVVGEFGRGGRVLLVDESELRIEVRFTAHDDSLILGPGKYGFHLEWSGIGMRDRCCISTVVDESCVSELSLGLSA